MQLNRSSFFIPLVVLGLWLGAGLALVPAMLESAFRGSGIAFLNESLAAHPTITHGFLLKEWYGVVIAGTAAILFVAALAHVLRQPEISQRFVGKAAPADIGAIRILVCSVLLISVLWEDVASTAALPREMIRPMGVIQMLYLLPGFDRLLTSEFALGLIEFVTGVLLVLGMLGWKTRAVLPMGAVAYLILGGLLRQYAWFYHTGLLALYLLIVLSLVPSQHGCSVDRLTRLWKGQAVPPKLPATRYGWMRYALWATLAIPYVVAGLSKLRNGGMTWWEASNFKFILYQSALRPMEFDFDASLLLTSAPDTVFEVLAISAVAGELLYGLVLFSRWARWVMPATMAVMHVGILFFQNILFFDLIVLQAIFFNFRPLLARIRGALAHRWGRLRLFYDGTLASHVRIVRLISAVDVFERIQIERRDESGRLEADFRDRSFVGDKVYQRIARSLPVVCWLSPIFYFPSLSRWIGHALSAPESVSPTSPVKVRRPHRRLSVRWRSWTARPQFTLFLVGLLCFFWVFRIEFYPFTGMQMFSHKRTEPVTYETALARLGSGEVVRAPVEQCIGAMSDSRYRRVLQMAFEPEKQRVTAAFLDSCRARWNRGVIRSEDRIESFEVQKWEWYYLRDPDHPNHGDMTDRKLFLVRDADEQDLKQRSGMTSTSEPR